MKILINADDFGLNDSCTKAIIYAFQKKIITDTTMVGNGDAFELAIDLIKKFGLGEKIGIHFNLTEGKPLTDNILLCPEFVCDGAFHGKINRVKPLNHYERQAVYKELTAQIERILKAEIPLSHADSHHHIHTGIFIAPIVKRVCQEHGIHKIRIHRNIGNIAVTKSIVKYIFNMWLRGNFRTTQYFGSLEDIENYGLKDNLEIMVHPDFNSEGLLIDRTDIINGVPVGKILTQLPNVQYISYKEL